MNRKPQEISNILKEQIRNYTSKIEMTETGTVVMVGDGIATVYGIKNCMAGELLEFSDGSVGLAQNLEEETVSVAILANTNHICEGTTVKRRGRCFPFLSEKRCSGAMSTLSAFRSTARATFTRPRCVR